MKSRLILVLAAGFIVGGCASYFKRKECEKTNWYQHGNNVAMSGKRLDADNFVKECRAVEAKMSYTELDTGFKAGMQQYCTNDNIYLVGKAGKPFSYDMCDGENAKKMRARYTEGLRVFCVPANGYRFGTSGGVYQDVCPKETESDWLTEYRKGRKIWLKASIDEKEREVQRLDSEASRLESQRSMLSMQYSSLANRTTTKRERVYDAATGTYREQVTSVPDEHARMRSQSLSSEISNVNYQIQRNRQQHQTLSDELSKMRTEIATL